MKRCLILLSVLVVALGGAASASVQQGDTELDFLGAWFSQNGDTGVDDIDVFFLSGSLGYFLTDNVQVSVAAFGAWTEVLGADLDIWGVGGKVKYHFMPTNQWVPYIGAQIFWADVDSEMELDDDLGADGDATLWGPIVGLRFELNANNDFFVEYQYHLWEGDVSSVLDDGHALFAGIIHQFK